MGSIYVVLLAACTVASAQADVVEQRDPASRVVPHKITEKQARERSLVGFEHPGAAAEHHMLKRQAPDDGVAIQKRYRRARRHMEKMPLHSITLGGLIPGRAGLQQPSRFIAENLKLLGTWESLGPGNVGGRTRTLVIHPRNAAIMYAGGVSGGVWKTVNSGGLWTPVGDEMANIAVNSLAMDQEDPRILYAGTGEGYFREEVRGTWLPLRGAGIFKTSDAGTTWQRLKSTEGSDFQWVNDLVISPHDSSRLYAATRSGVWRSADSGESWESLLQTPAKGGCLDLATRSDTGADWMLASCGTLDQATVYRTEDAASAAASWEAVLSENGMGRTTLAVAPSDQDVVYALSASNPGGPGGNYEQGLFAVFRSDQAGEAGSWQATVRNTDSTRLNTLLLTNPAAATYIDCGWADYNSWVNMGWYCNVIAVDPVDPDIVWAAGVDLFRSDDGGRNWGLASYWWLDGDYAQFAHADQHAIAFHPNYNGVTNRRMFTANDGGIFRSDNSRARVGYGTAGICDPNQTSMRWTSLNNHLGITQFYHGLPYPNGDRYLGGTQDNGTNRGSDAGGSESWQHIFGGDGGYVAIDPTDTRVLYVEYQWARFQKSTNGGVSFEEAQDGISDPGSTFLFITPFVMDPNDPEVLWTGGRRMWRTINGAGRWTEGSSSLARNGIVSAVAVAPGDSNTVLAGTTDGAIYRHTNALTAGRTTQWASARPQETYVSWIAFDPHDTDVVYATYAEFGGEHVFRSADQGITWQAVGGTGNARLPDIPVHSIVVDPVHRGRLYVGTDLGVFTSTNEGHTWAVENTGFAAVVTESLAMTVDDSGNGVLFAFTHGRGAWRVVVDAAPPAPRGPIRNRFP